ncbi:MAG: twin-arginine translocation signal domain-containing protein [Betaproteobacteria bacterium]|nr:twin-arginine translocation signal domain-containing protein [Betaproteobacteria bacterium]
MLKTVLTADRMDVATFARRRFLGASLAAGVLAVTPSMPVYAQSVRPAGRAEALAEELYWYLADW